MLHVDSPIRLALLHNIAHNNNRSKHRRDREPVKVKRHVVDSDSPSNEHHERYHHQGALHTPLQSKRDTSVHSIIHCTFDRQKLVAEDGQYDDSDECAGDIVLGNHAMDAVRCKLDAEGEDDGKANKRADGRRFRE